MLDGSQALFFLGPLAISSTVVIAPVIKHVNHAA